MTQHPPGRVHGVSSIHVYRGTSLIRNTPLLGPYIRTMSSASIHRENCSLPPHRLHHFLERYASEAPHERESERNREGEGREEGKERKRE